MATLQAADPHSLDGEKPLWIGPGYGVRPGYARVRTFWIVWFEALRRVALVTLARLN